MTLRGFSWLFAACLPVLAQVDRANLSGSVTDATGAAVVGVEVEALLGATGLKRMATTSDTGLFVLPGLPVGKYTVVVSKAGFQSVKQDSLVLSTGQRRTLDLTMQLSPSRPRWKYRPAPWRLSRRQPKSGRPSKPNRFAISRSTDAIGAR